MFTDDVTVSLWISWWSGHY